MNIILSIAILLMGVGMLIYGAHDIFSTPSENRDYARKLNSNCIMYGVIMVAFGALILAMSISGYKSCPQCSEKYKTTDELSYCEHCGYDLNDYEYECSGCGKVYEELDDISYCGKCGESIAE